jgi:DNA-binding NtrC family response regulator
MTASTLLIVEPDILVRHPLAEYLRECGYQVLEAQGAAEAHRLLTSGAIEVDVVLADAGAAGDGAFALASWIRGHQPQVQVILAGTVAKAAEKAGDLCEEGPALAKPYDHRQVHDHIMRLIAARERGG